MNKFIMAYEIMQNGVTMIGQVRILAIDKIRYENYARQNGLEVKDGPRSLAYLLYSALTREGRIVNDIDFDDFAMNILIDFETNPDTDTSESEANPTQ